MASLATAIDAGPYDSQHEQDVHPNGKRKAEDSGQPQQRAKRNRYISIACNECKRRKIKCNGEAPCKRCGNLNLECIYAPNCCSGFKDSQEYREMSQMLATLDGHVSRLYQEMNNLRTQLGVDIMAVEQPPTHLDPLLQSPQQQKHSYAASQGTPAAAMPPSSPASLRPRGTPQISSYPRFKGPTSSDFNFGVAKSSLQAMGITSLNDVDEGATSGGPATREQTPDGAPPSRQVRKEWHADKDPIWRIELDEAIRLCRVFEDEMGLMYPFLNMDKLATYTRNLYRFMDAAHRSGFMQQGLPGADALDDDDTNILKMVIACALTTEGAGNSELGRKIFEYVHPAIENLLLGNNGKKGIRLLVLTAMYEFHRDNEPTAWRIIGLSVRLCIELGLHRREIYEAMQNESERSETILLFWTVYVLDRRWSFGTGMPFALQDQDIDPRLPKPGDKSPYLSAMIQYSAIGAKVWQSVISSTSRAAAPIDTGNMGYLDYQIVQWHRNIPAHLQFEWPPPSQSSRPSTSSSTSESRAGRRLRMLLYLRGNQMRIAIYHPVLHTATDIIQHRSQAQTVVDVAKNTIQVLTHINQTSDLYRTQQVLFNAFLTSALAVLFLAVAHTPAEFAESVREEFYMAIELVRGFSTGSWISKRLWRTTIRMVKEFGPKLGLVSQNDAEGPNGQSRSELESSRSAAVAMAGLAGHHVDEMELFQPSSDQNWNSTPGAVSNPENMVNNLTSLFEAVGGYQTIGSGSVTLNGGQGTEMLYNTAGTGEGIETLSHAAFGDEGLANILKDLF